MPLIRASRETVRIDLPSPGEWVEVKRTLGRNDRLTVSRRAGEAMRIIIDASGARRAEIDAVLAQELADYAVLEVAIVRWSFPDPLTPENIRCLDDESLAVIKARLDELYPAERTETERKN